jgi:membrane fusion protein, heavy metal efflux system
MTSHRFASETIGRMLLAVACAVVATSCRARDDASTADADSASGTARDSIVTLTAAQRANAGLQFAMVASRTEAGTLEASAQIEPAAERMAVIASRVPGRILSVNAALGDRVRAGSALVVLDSPEVGQAKADYLSALATANVTRETATREKQLFDRRISAEREWREAEAEALRAEAAARAAENRLHALGVEDSELEALRNERHYDATMTLRSPITGLIAERQAAAGQIVEPMNALLTVVDLREVWTVVDVYEQNISQVRTGQSVEVVTTAYPNEIFRGRVASVGAVIEAQSRSVKVRITLANPGERLKPGMFATVHIQGIHSYATPTIYVPSGAVQRDGNRSIVFLPRGDSNFVAREVRVGRQSGDTVEILQGLVAGERIVTAGAFLLKSELRKGELGEGDEHKGGSS